ncbi:MAG: hypothetical protein M1831_001616 [Alyxoria varia]|nr:MAG: hypothetical protein M1831_001616 [Alyxoria varia]
MNSSSAVTGADASIFQEAFSSVIKDPQERRSFPIATHDDLCTTIADIQNDQGKTKTAQNLTRISRFLEAMEDFERIAKVYLNVHEAVAFIWGPAKFLLQATRNHVDLFNALLESYDEIGEYLPLLKNYQRLLQNDTQLRATIKSVYEDILKFHYLATKRFAQGKRKKLIQAIWKTSRTDFNPILESLKRHKFLLDTQEFRLKLEGTARENTRREEQERLREVHAWIGYDYVAEDDQEHFENIRSYVVQDSGRWALERPQYKQWASSGRQMSPLLWLNGIPGAGKTIVASCIVKDLQTFAATFVVFFYFKEGDKDRNSLSASLRGVLRQMLDHNPALLPHYYDKASRYGAPTINREKTLKELAKDALNSLDKVFVVIDGIDERAEEEQKKIVDFFVTATAPQPEPSDIRCLLVSQDEKVPSSKLSMRPTLTITEQDNREDIRQYSENLAGQIKEKFELDTDFEQKIISQVLHYTKGMFLYAKLVLENLLDQLNCEMLEEELLEINFPQGIHQAYNRIVERVQKSKSQHRETAFRILGFLACAKRPMMWHELQGILAFDEKERIVKYQSRKLRVKNVKELCGSLVRDRTGRGGEQLELVHSTARAYLTAENLILPDMQEIELARLCVSLANAPGFQTDDSDDTILKYLQEGQYVFADYAVAYWAPHTMSSPWSSKDGSLKDALDALQDCLEELLDLHVQTDNE